jgi:hypothetical protein
MGRMLLLAAALALSACNSDFYRSLYESIQARNDARRTPTEREMNPAPSYDEYEKEREAAAAKR